jgi:DNA-binding response OmpR family regulator
MLPDLNRILIAEDHHVSRHLLERNLSSWGFDVITADNGATAWQILESEEAPPLAIVDWMMPGLNGLEVCRRLRALQGRSYVYVILLTAKSQKEELAEGLEAGADDYIVKPFDSDELRARLRVGQRVVALERRVAAYESDVESTTSEATRLKRLLPICTYCKSVRDRADYWHEIEQYIHAETGTDFTHGVCPACMERITKEGKL